MAFNFQRMHMPICPLCIELGEVSLPKALVRSEGWCRACSLRGSVYVNVIVEEKQYKKIRLILTKGVRECPLEEVPLYMGSHIALVRWVANKRLEVGK